MHQEPLELVRVNASHAAPGLCLSKGVAVAGPGWFDSSWDLRCGLAVREGWPSDISLAIWVDAFVGAQPLPRVAATVSPSASTAIA